MSHSMNCLACQVDEKDKMTFGELGAIKVRHGMSGILCSDQGEFHILITPSHMLVL